MRRLKFKGSLALCLALTLVTLTVSAQPRGGFPVGRPGEQGQRGGMRDKSSDTLLTTLKNTVIPQFRQFAYSDTETGKTMAYNLFIPADYDGSGKYPLLLFIADASTVNQDVTVPLSQGYGALLFACERDQRAHPCFVLVPQYTTVTVGDSFSTGYEVEMTIRLLDYLQQEYKIDSDRLYTTGQSMGGMMSLYFNIAHPNLFAASLFVGCQWDTGKMTDFVNDKFFYIVAAGDMKAPSGMAALKKVLEDNDGVVECAEWSARLPQREQDSLAQAVIDKGCNNNMITFTLGTTLPEGTKSSSRAGEHMTSFDFAYKLTPVRDWLFLQQR